MYRYRSLRPKLASKQRDATQHEHSKHLAPDSDRTRSQERPLSALERARDKPLHTEHESCQRVGTAIEYSARTGATTVCWHDTSLWKNNKSTSQHMQRLETVANMTDETTNQATRPSYGKHGNDADSWMISKNRASFYVSYTHTTCCLHPPSQNIENDVEFFHCKCSSTWSIIYLPIIKVPYGFTCPCVGYSVAYDDGIASHRPSQELVLEWKPMIREKVLQPHDAAPRDPRPLHARRSRSA